MSAASDLWAAGNDFATVLGICACGNEVAGRPPLIR
jgi:hypothetical protein